MKLILIAVTFITLSVLIGCKSYKPEILDGPGMIYIDSHYRTEYANCLPFDDVKGSPYLAIAYLGRGDEIRSNIDSYTLKFFGNLDDAKIDLIKTYELEGDYWFLVIPKYYSTVNLKKDNDVIECASYSGEPFFVRCNQDITVNIFETVDINYILAVNEDNKLKDIDENIWDISSSDEMNLMLEGE